MSDIYALDAPIQSFAVANPFVINTNKACYSCGKQLKPFCIYGRSKQLEYNVADISNFTGILDKNTNLVDEIAKARSEAYKGVLSLDLDDPIKKKLLFFDYLLSVSMCYVEIPKYVTKDGYAQQSYDKFLCTKNPRIMSAWTGFSLSEVQGKYAVKCQTRQVECQNNEIKLVKLNATAKGNSLTVPRSAFNVENMVCIPFYMLHAFICGYLDGNKDDIVKFTYLKDNGTIRELVTTLNPDILMQVYNDNNIVSKMLAGVDINSTNQGSISMSSKAHRGYIKVPELGASIYDETGVRSLNIARLVKAEKITLEDVDLQYINVDLNSVIDNFSNSVDYIVLKNPTEIPNLYKAVVGEEAQDTDIVVLQNKMMNFVRARFAILSTTYLKTLHKFMKDNPLWFPVYVGSPVTPTSSVTFGVSEEFTF